MGAALWASPAFADPPAEGTPPPPPPSAPVPETTPTPPPPPPVPTQTESMPATKPETLPPISVGAWTRVGASFQNANDPKKLNDFKMDSAYVELHAGGKIHKNFGVTLNLNGNLQNFGTGNPMTPATEGYVGASTVGIMDAIIQFDPYDELHIWAGHLLVPVDRSNASGPFFMLPWNYPGFMSAGNSLVITAPKEGPYGRNNGMVVWGDINGGQLTYLAGVFDNSDRTTAPLYSGRVRLSLLDKEGGFWGNGSYFGDKDLFTIAVGGQYQNNPLGKDYALVNGDILFEKKLGGGSYFTAELALYKYFVNAGVSFAGYGLLSYTTAPLGYGGLQPMVRYQWGTNKGGGDMSWNIDGGLAYLIKGPGLRFLATYGHTDLGSFAPGVTGNQIQLGAQAIFF